MQKKTSRLQSWFGVQDMTVGRPMDSLVRFSIPLLVGNLAQQLYNTVDSIVVGQYIGRRGDGGPYPEPAAGAVHGYCHRREHPFGAVFRRA